MARLPAGPARAAGLGGGTHCWRFFIADFQGGFDELSLDPLAITPIADPEPDLPGNHMNDGKADASGAIWYGTMDMAEEQDSGFTRPSPERLSDRQPFITFTEAGGYPVGALDRTITLPALQITNVALCGEALDRLFVTSADIGLLASDVDGALHEIDARVCGLPANLSPA